MSRGRENMRIHNFLSFSCTLQSDRYARAIIQMTCSLMYEENAVVGNIRNCLIGRDRFVPVGEFIRFVCDNVINLAIRWIFADNLKTWCYKILIGIVYLRRKGSFRFLLLCLINILINAAITFIILLALAQKALFFRDKLSSGKMTFSLYYEVSILSSSR